MVVDGGESAPDIDETGQVGTVFVRSGRVRLRVDTGGLDPAQSRPLLGRGLKTWGLDLEHPPPEAGHFCDGVLEHRVRRVIEVLFGQGAVESDDRGPVDVQLIGVVRHRFE